MTIEVFGHVQALETRGPDAVLVRIQVEASRMDAGFLGAPMIAVIASPAEVDSYKPGMAIHIQIRPSFCRSNTAETFVHPYGNSPHETCACGAKVPTDRYVIHSCGDRLSPLCKHYSAQERDSNG